MKFNWKQKDFRAVLAAFTLIAASGGVWFVGDAIDTRRLTTYVDHHLTYGEYAKFYTALKTNFPDDYTVVRDGLVQLTKRRAGKEAFAILLRASGERLQARHVEDFAAASGPALARFRAAEIAWKEALFKRSAQECRGPEQSQLSPTESLADEEAISFQVGEEQYAMVMAMADGRVAKIHRGAPPPEAYPALHQALVHQGITPVEMGIGGSNEMPAGISTSELCQVQLRTLKAVNSLSPDQADAFTVAAFRKGVWAATQQRAP